MKEVDSLLARSDRYLKSAGLLINDKDYESAVSRAYYAMFFAVEAALLTKGIAFSSHKAVLSAFGEHFVKTGVFTKEMSKSLTRAFEKRQICDYEFTFILAENEAVEVLKEAKNFVSVIADFLRRQP